MSDIILTDEQILAILDSIKNKSSGSFSILEFGRLISQETSKLNPIKDVDRGISQK